MRLITVGSAADDSSRLGFLLGTCWGDGSMIRSSLRSPPVANDGVLRFSVVDPVLTTVWNSRIPDSRNDGALWAGRGSNVMALAGASVSYGRLRVIVGPQLTWSENEAFPLLPSPNPERSGFASPWHSGVVSADIPSRFGTGAYTRVDPGESTIEAAVGPFGFGVSSTEQWWGPGLENAIVMSDNAAGIPRAFTRTTRPIMTRFGAFEGSWMLGALTESPYFDRDGRNNLRSLSAGVATLRVRADSDLTVGIERAVYAHVGGVGGIPAHLADIFTDWQRASVSVDPERRSDQLFGLFARWAFPDAGFEAHVEWVKVRLPNSIRSLEVDPQANQGYTLGLSWARIVAPLTTVRLEAEATTLEQTPSVARSLVPEFYASRAVVQGYTQEGQVIGASIGPGSSSQHVGATLLRDHWELGGMLQRIRWDDDAYYESPNGTSYLSHDVGLSAAITGRYASRRIGIEAGVTRTYRTNYLFQGINLDPFTSPFAVKNTTLFLRLTPRL